MGDNGRSNPDEGTLQITPCVAAHLDNWTAQKYRRTSALFQQVDLPTHQRSSCPGKSGVLQS